MSLQTGLARLLDDPRATLKGGRVGLVANPTTVTGTLAHAADLLHAHPDVDLRLLFGPEHGVRGAQPYMADVDDGRDLGTGLPVRSLYGRSFASLAPSAADLAALDVLLFDVQDVGSRYYTYAATMALCMRAAAAAGTRVVVLDRPNPIGGTQVEGGGLLPGLENFCGLYPVPQRHGMTVGELARLYNGAFGIGCELTVVPCSGWRRDAYFEATGLPWVMPSPQMPTVDTALVYPGMCLLEGTQVSEGRGTTRPFELFGAPWVDPRAVAAALAPLALPGVRLRPCAFVPTFDKHAGQECSGLQLHVTDRHTFLPWRTGLAVVWALRQAHPTAFGWRREPYEFRADVPAFDLLCGTSTAREAIDAGADFAAVVAAAEPERRTYDDHRGAALLY